MVLHERPKSPLTGLALILGPSMMNTFFGVLIGFPAVLGLLLADNNVAISCLELFLIWLGVSIAVHTFPTFKDAEAATNLAASAHNPKWMQIMGLPFSALMHMGAIGRIFWLDVLYALIVVIGMPILFFEILQMAF